MDRICILATTETASGHTNLDSLTITGGRKAGAFPNDRGGAVCNPGGTVVLNRCTILSNTASFEILLDPNRDLLRGKRN